MASDKLDWLLPPLLCGLAMILASGVKGFWWCLTYLLLSTAALFVLHARWRRLGVFVEAADAKRGSAKWLAGSRFVCWGVAFIGVGFPYRLTAARQWDA
eukprot:s1735_g4.t1